MKSRTKGSILTFLILVALVFSVVFVAGSVTSTVSAQTTTTVVRHRRHKRSFWRKHRDKLTVAGTGLAGAGIGAIAGGKKGAAIGAAVGAGSGALYTYKIRKRHRRHVRRY